MVAARILHEIAAGSVDEDDRLRRAHLAEAFVMPIYRRGQFMGWRCIPLAAIHAGRSEATTRAARD
jgi:hypothetical protein